MAKKIGVKGVASSSDILGHKFGKLTGRFAQLEAMTTSPGEYSRSSSRGKRTQGNGMGGVALNPA